LACPARVRGSPRQPDDLVAVCSFRPEAPGWRRWTCSECAQLAGGARSCPATAAGQAPLNRYKLSPCRRRVLFVFLLSPHASSRPLANPASVLRSRPHHPLPSSHPSTPPCPSGVTHLNISQVTCKLRVSFKERCLCVWIASVVPAALPFRVTRNHIHPPPCGISWLLCRR